ncbi:uncharacterized protein LOC113311305 [Papaver somniferum]|uniref:uncharacterized protein LOC113311305 n=1 Tax=Papaver somniferum TaxID=3469 RepID=UPI000E6F7737|nr:uncharacterized protein LOC113311305 [Papaver somniferum]
MKSRYHPAINMMLQVSEVQRMGDANNEDDLIRQLIGTAVRTPRAFDLNAGIPHHLFKTLSLWVSFGCISALMLKIIFWNVKSLRAIKRRGRVRVWLSINKPDIIVFQESLLPVCNDAIVRQIWGPGPMDWRALDAIGRSGGVLIIWNTKKVVLENYIIGNYSVNISCFDNLVWLLSGAYGPCATDERKLLWRELNLMYNIWELPWCLCGDFNEVRFIRERFRFLVNDAWDNQFHSITVSALAKPFSDHKPVCLVCDLEDWGPPPFRKCEKALSEIAALDEIGDDNALSSSQVYDRNNKKLEFENLADMKHLHWLGKSRMKWQLDGDRNTKFFHRITKMRRRRNTFAKLKINDNWVDDKQVIKDSIVKHFEDRFQCGDDHRMDLSGMLEVFTGTRYH